MDSDGVQSGSSVCVPEWKGSKLGGLVLGFGSILHGSNAKIKGGWKISSRKKKKKRSTQSAAGWLDCSASVGKGPWSKRLQKTNEKTVQKSH